MNAPRARTLPTGYRRAIHLHCLLLRRVNSPFLRSFRENDLRRGFMEKHLSPSSRLRFCGHGKRHGKQGFPHLLRTTENRRLLCSKHFPTSPTTPTAVNNPIHSFPSKEKEGLGYFPTSK